ncbi:MAG: twin-arginine translocation signal domain-containing protein, partial [Atopobiaceae bacterium]|nr:twin-arginine translocation signal domain-containing protein [Atopobiaceae bacterium]
MQNITRRNFLRVAAATSAASVLAACGQSQEPAEEPAEEGGEEPAQETGDGSYPIEPEELGSGDVKWSEEDVDSHKLVTQEGGATLSYSP